MGKSTVFDLDSMPFITIVHQSRELLKIQEEGMAISERDESGYARRLSKDQQELVKIKDELGLRHQDYAVMLGIGVPRLSSYTYGRTTSVPKEIMQRARQLLIENGTLTETTVTRFSRPMAEILVDWSTQLGADSNDEIAQYIGVTAMTVYRWRKNENRPDMTGLSRYDRIVTRIAEGIRKAEAKSGKK